MQVDSPSEMLENKLFHEISLGGTACLVRTLKLSDIAAFAAVSGDTNPAHLDVEFARHSLFHGVIGHGMWTGSLISTVLGTQFPGPGSIYLDQSLHFKRPVKVGDTLTVLITVKSKNAARHSVNFDCVITNQKGEQVVVGEASVLAPTEKVKRPRILTPEIHVFDPNQRLADFIGCASGLAPVTCGVVHPCDELSLRGLIEAAEQNIIVPVLLGPESKLLGLADQFNLDIKPFKLIAVPHSHAAADMAVEMVATGQLESLMKGSLHTDEMMHAVVARHELRTKHRLSHVFRFDVPLYDKPLFISDAALNIQPTLMEKVDIVQNAINLTHILGTSEPKVAILSAIETVRPDIPSTLDAAALCKMVDRGQITGALLDGPLAFDNAISKASIKVKQIESNVAGQADILIVPDLVSGNMLAKQLEYFAGAMACGIVLGSKCPIALTSRSDSVSARVASAQLAKVVAHHYREHKP